MARIFRAYAIFKHTDGSCIELSVGEHETSKDAYTAILNKCVDVFGKLGTEGYRLLYANVYESVNNDAIRLADYGWFVEDNIHNKLFAKVDDAEQGNNQ